MATHYARPYSPHSLDVSFPSFQPPQAAAGLWLPCILSSHHQEVRWDYKDACAPSSLSVYIAISVSTPLANPIMARPLHWAHNWNLFSSLAWGRWGRPSALFTSPDLVGVLFAVPGPWRIPWPACVCLCLLWKLPLTHTYKSAGEPLVISNSFTGCTKRSLGIAEAILKTLRPPSLCAHERTLDHPKSSCYSSQSSRVYSVTSIALRVSHAPCHLILTITIF